MQKSGQKDQFKMSGVVQSILVTILILSAKTLRKMQVMRVNLNESNNSNMDEYH